MCNTTSIVVRFASILISAVILVGCNGSSDGGGGSSADGRSEGGGAGSASFNSGSGNPDADKALMAKIEQHWIKTPDGWTTEFTEQLPLNPPMRVLQQYRDFKYTLAPETLSEADRLNGIEWKSWPDFGTTAMRYWREQDNYEYPKGWSRWEEQAPTFRPSVYKRNGQWVVEDHNYGSMFDGKKPGDIPAS